MVDPGLQYELNVPKPWFASRLLSSMNILHIRKPQTQLSLDNLEELKRAFGPWKWGGNQHLEEDNTLLLESDVTGPLAKSTARPFRKDSSAERRKFFTKRNLDRSKVRFSTKYIYGMEVNCCIYSLNFIDYFF